MRKIIMILMAVALIALPTMAQQQEWQTSTMQTSGSAYSSQVTPVGATAAPSEATTTTATYAPGRPGTIRRGFDDTPNPGQGNPGSPIGDPVWPLMLMAIALAAYTAIKRRRQTAKN